MTYTLTRGGVLRDLDGAFIPNDERNADWQEYQDWVARGGEPTPIPAPSKDDLKAYAAQAQSRVLLSGITVNVSSSGQPINILCDGDNNTRGDLALLAHFGKEFPAETKVWIDNNNVSTTLAGVQFVTLATLVGFWITNTYDSMSGLIGEIDAGTITTTAQIDAHSWPQS